jgi:hypothetical protein
MSFFVTGNSGTSTAEHTDVRIWDPAASKYLPLQKGSPYRRYLDMVVDVESGKPITSAFPVTSEWNPNRVHPVHGGVRPHHGVDYGTPTGRRLQVKGAEGLSYKWDEGGGGHMAIAPFKASDGRRLELLLLHGDKTTKDLLPAFGSGMKPQPAATPAMPAATTGAASAAAAAPPAPPPEPAWRTAAGAPDRITDQGQKGYWEQAHIQEWAKSNRELAEAAVQRVGGSADWLVTPVDNGAVSMVRTTSGLLTEPDTRRYPPTRRGL